MREGEKRRPVAGGPAAARRTLSRSVPSCSAMMVRTSDSTEALSCGRRGGGGGRSEVDGRVGADGHAARIGGLLPPHSPRRRARSCAGRAWRGGPWPAAQPGGRCRFAQDRALAGAWDGRDSSLQAPRDPPRPPNWPPGAPTRPHGSARAQRRRSAWLLGGCSDRAEGSRGREGRWLRADGSWPPSGATPDFISGSQIDAGDPCSSTDDMQGLGRLPLECQGACPPPPAAAAAALRRPCSRIARKRGSFHSGVTSMGQEAAVNGGRGATGQCRGFKMWQRSAERGAGRRRPQCAVRQQHAGMLTNGGGEPVSVMSLKKEGQQRGWEAIRWGRAHEEAVKGRGQHT